jgi:hypothetical protein
MYALLGLFLIIISVLIVSVQPYINFAPWRDWFQKYGDETTNNCIPLTLMAYYYGPGIFYSIVKSLTQESKVFQHEWTIDFLMSIMQGQAYGLVPGGVLIPRYLCISLAPELNKPIPGYPNGFPSPHNGSWPTDLQGWRTLFQNEWGQHIVNGNWSPDTTAWQNPSNFLYRIWGISAYSPIVEAFVTGQSSSGNIILYPSAMEPLLGITDSGAGGWYGFVKAGDNWGDMGQDNIRQIVWSSDIPSYIKNPPVPTTGKKCDAATVAGGTLSYALAAGGIAAMLAGPLGWITAGIIFAAGTVAGGVITGAQNKCPGLGG